MKTEILSWIVPGLVAIVGNVIFYMIIKSRIDKSIERHKISYAGIYKEKIAIHKEILNLLYKLKLKTLQYKNIGNSNQAEELFADFNKFIHHFLMNKPFINDQILDGLQKFTNELQSCFDSFYLYFSLSDQGGLDPNKSTEEIKNFFESVNKINSNKPFKNPEDLIVNEMKRDLNVEY